MGNTPVCRETSKSIFIPGKQRFTIKQNVTWQTSDILCRIIGSHSGGYEESCLLSYNAV
jgi:hypothetical protein